MILQQEAVQEGSARARQAGDEDRPLDPLLEYFGRSSLFLAQTQQSWTEIAPRPSASRNAQRGSARPPRGKHAAEFRSGSSKGVEPKSTKLVRRLARAISSSALQRIAHSCRAQR